MNHQQLAEAARHVSRTYPEFEVENVTIRGVRLKAFKNAPRNLAELLARSASDFADRDLLVRGCERLTYREFQERVSGVAAALRDIVGVRPGERVAIAMRNRIEYLIFAMAAGAVGAVVVHLNAWWTSDEFDYALADCEARVVFADAARVEWLANCIRISELELILADPDGRSARTFGELLTFEATPDDRSVIVAPDDDAAIIYTSGSTGYPKGVVLTHRNIISAIWSWLMVGPVQEALELPSLPTPPERAALQPANLVTVPFFHVSGMNTCFLLTLAMGGKAVILDKWDAERAAELIAQESITRFWGVPTMTADLLALGERGHNQLATLTAFDAGGAKQPPEQVRRITLQHPEINPSTGFGMTETSGLGLRASGSVYAGQPDAAGYLIPPLQEMRILSQNGSILPTGEVGELVLKSPAVMRCYLNQPEATSAVLCDGWMHTGDLARVDETGLVFIAGRKKDIIIRGGENISCLEVEVAMHEHPAVLEACVFPVPDERLGELVGVAIQQAKGELVNLMTLRSFLAASLAQFKLPERLWIFDHPLARGPTEKIDKSQVRSTCLAKLDPGNPC